MVFARRHRRAALQNKAVADGRAAEDRARDEEDRPDAPACGFVGARRDGRAERTLPGRSFSRTFAGVSGLVMTKLDGTARGGILIAIAAKFGLPVHFVGVGGGHRRSRAILGQGLCPGDRRDRMKSPLPPGRKPDGNCAAARANMSSDE